MRQLKKKRISRFLYLFFLDHVIHYTISSSGVICKSVNPCRLSLCLKDPSKFRYSPERMKKAMSCQSDEFPREGRQGRRQSGKHPSLVLKLKYLFLMCKPIHYCVCESTRKWYGRHIMTLVFSNLDPIWPMLKLSVSHVANGYTTCFVSLDSDSALRATFT